MGARVLIGSSAGVTALPIRSRVRDVPLGARPRAHSVAAPHHRERTRLQSRARPRGARATLRRRRPALLGRETISHRLTERPPTVARRAMRYRAAGLELTTS